MKKEEFLTDGVRVNEMGYLVNEEGKRVNHKGEELVEVDAEAYMKSMEARVFSYFCFAGAAFVFVIYLAIISANTESPLTRDEHFMYLGLIAVGSALGTLFAISSRWKRRVYKEPKFVVNLPKSSVRRLENPDSIVGTISNEATNLDRNGDGRVLISEVYTLTEEEVLEKICQVDEDFSVLDFKDYAHSVFTLVQDSWSKNNYRGLRPYESDLLYVRHKVRIESMIKDNITNRRSHIRVKGSLLKDYKIEDDKEVLVVALTANMKVENTENMYMTKDGDFPYVLKFVRKKGVKTNTKRHLSTGNCCNCGAVIDVDDNGICKYCETSVVSGESDWILSDIKNIKIQGM